MIEGLDHIGDEHKCNVCSCIFTDDEGGTIGYFGILPVAFCPTCLCSMEDMCDQFRIDDEDLKVLGHTLFDLSRNCPKEYESTLMEAANLIYKMAEAV